MRDYPTGSELLSTAETLLREQLLPNLPAEQRHTALMIARSMGIAARQLHGGDAPARLELAALELLLGIPRAPEAADTITLRAQLVDANRQLVGLIRRGGADTGERHAEVFRHLREITRQRVAESNPRYLERPAP
ncbi:DUF6285 domain-containing protein [Pseudomonas sp. MOB-449]|nr:DUF6285 domain-containing protein [Pseudomonas sp. MOB-449]